VEILSELATIPGVSGAHIMAPLNERAIPEVIRTFRDREMSRVRKGGQA
jgi:hypothetical protein